VEVPYVEDEEETLNCVKTHSNDTQVAKVESLPDMDEPVSPLKLNSTGNEIPDKPEQIAEPGPPENPIEEEVKTRGTSEGEAPHVRFASEVDFAPAYKTETPKTPDPIKPEPSNVVQVTSANRRASSISGLMSVCPKEFR
jgi:hypothetical protein